MEVQVLSWAPFFSDTLLFSNLFIGGIRYLLRRGGAADVALNELGVRNKPPRLATTL